MKELFFFYFSIFENKIKIKIEKISFFFDLILKAKNNDYR